MPVYRARSISRFLWDLTPIPLHLQVLSRHERVVNLMDARGRLWAVAHPQVGNGPFHVVLAYPVPLVDLTPGTPAQWDGATLWVGDWQIAIESAQIWDSSLARSLTPIPTHHWLLARDQAHRLLAPTAPWAEMDSHTWARLHAGIDLLAQARVHADASAFEEAVNRLIGLGPGLTPAGDDVLLGWMARWWMSLPSPSAANLNLGQLVEAVRDRTTRLSAAWLAHAASGRFAEPWLQLQAALAAGDAQAMDYALARIAQIGATSGRLALLGAFSMP